MIEITARIAIIALIFLSPPILVILVLREFSNVASKHRWRIALTLAVLADWALLIAWLFAGSEFGRHKLNTGVTDVCLLSSLLLLVGSTVSSLGRWKLCAASLVLVSLWIWTEQRRALSDNGSVLSVFISRVADTIGCPPGEYTLAVLHKMANYERREHYDAAINAGVAWTQAHPQDGLNDMVFIGIGWEYLKKAQHDSMHVDDDVHQALLYRDKALPAGSENQIGWHSVKAMRDLALLSEVAGDLSPMRRCLQYENSIKLLERRTAMLRDKQDEISRRFVPDKEDLTVKDVEYFSDETRAATERVQRKQQGDGCGSGR